MESIRNSNRSKRPGGGISGGALLGMAQVFKRSTMFKPVRGADLTDDNIMVCLLNKKNKQLRAKLRL